MYDLLLSADYMVPDPDALAATFIKALGLPHQPPTARQNFENHPWIAHFLQVNPVLAVAPTTLEPQSYVEWPGNIDPYFAEFLDSLERFQGAFRPIKAHATVLTSSDMPGVIDRLMERRIPIRIAPWSERLPFDRVWTGVTPENPRYDPSFDGGLMIEVIPTSAVERHIGGLSTPPEPDPKPGEIVRVVNRAFIVRDLGATLRALAASLGLEPNEPVTTHVDEGYRRARISFGFSNSATLDLLQPLRGESEVGHYLNTWGPGPYYERIAVKELDVKADDLRSRGTRFTVRNATSAAGRRVVADPNDLGGAVIEFVEWDR